MLACLTVGGAAGAAPAWAQTADQLFDDRTLHDLRIYIHGRDLEALRTHRDASMFFPVDVVWGGVRVTTAGVRSRGMASRNAAKPALLLNFDRYVRGQTFLGLTELALDNLVTDASSLRESVTMSFFRRLAHPAPREAFGRLHINDIYQGVYALVESINPQFLARSGYDPEGYLFEKVYVGPFRGEDRGNIAAFAQLFEARTRQLESDSVLYGPIRDLFADVNRGSGRAWRDTVARYIDLDEFVAHVAIETFLADEDGVLGFAGMANFYLYRSGAGAHRLIPWDKDGTFERIDFPIFKRASENVLFKKAITFEDLRMQYLQVLEQCARAAADGGWLEGEIRRLASLVSPAIREYPFKPYSNEQHDATVAFLIEFARQRPRFVLDQVATARAER
jgi:spore coat protein H